MDVAWCCGLHSRLPLWNPRFDSHSGLNVNRPLFQLVGLHKYILEEFVFTLFIYLIGHEHGREIIQMMILRFTSYSDQEILNGH